MLSFDPKLPQLSEQESSDGRVPVSFYRRFQERFYTLWRELARNDERLRAEFASGTYTPTLTAVNNCTVSLWGADFQWLRVGKVVTVSGAIDVDPTSGVSGTLTSWAVSLPLASAFSDVGNAGGAASCGYDSATAYADTTNDRVQMDTFLINNGASARLWTCSFTYVVI